MSEESTETIEKLAAQAEALCPVLDIIDNPVEVVGKDIVFYPWFVSPQTTESKVTIIIPT